jgi:hypothetical protein
MTDQEWNAWVEPYQAAVLELDVARLPGRIKLAQKIIRKRMAELKDHANNHRERLAMLDALQALNDLRRLNPPKP